MFALLAAAAATPIAIEAVGMEPQLRIVRQEAAKQGWPITCVGRAGEQGVLRVQVRDGTPRSVVDGFIEALTPVVASVGNLGVDPTKRSCDQAPVTGSSSRPVR